MAHDYMKDYVVGYKDKYIRWVLRNDESPHYEVWGYLNKEFMVNKQGAFFMQGGIPKEQFDIFRVPRNGHHLVEVWIDGKKILG